MVLNCTPLDAETANLVGLLFGVVAADDLPAHVDEVADRFARRPRVLIMATLQQSARSLVSSDVEDLSADVRGTR